MIGVLLRRPRPFAAPHRSVHSGGRGDLYRCGPAGVLRNSARVGGPAPEMRHAAHCTAPVTGQLHYRRFLRSHTHNGENSFVASWAFLAPSLRRAASMSESAGSVGSVGSVGSAESVELFRHELHQRLPLLEDALPAAGVAQMAEWLRATRRAGIRLAARPEGEVEKKEGEGVQAKGKEKENSQQVVPWRVRDAAPERHQVFDMQQRLARLVGAVAVRAREELLCAERNAKSRRQIATAQRMRAEIEDDLSWHGVRPQCNVARIE